MTFKTLPFTCRTSSSGATLARNLLWLAMLLGLLAGVNADFNCSEILNANPTGVSTTCTCVSDAYVFNGASSPPVCACAQNAIAIGVQGYCIKCSSLSFTTGAVASTNSCVCNPNYIWNSTWSECVLGCGTISNSVGTPNGSLTCDCSYPYTWDSVNNRCSFDC